MIQFGWTASESDGGVSLDEYKIYWDGSSGSTDLTTFVEIGTKPASDTLTFTQSSNLTPGSTYTFAVRATNAVGLSAYSDTIAIMAASEPAAPSIFRTDA